MTIPVFGVAGWKNSGKTTLCARLITEFTARGYKVAAVKQRITASISTIQPRQFQVSRGRCTE
jgi:molybdopterin-guanine dinucleotide biosynthesis protein MobB